MIKTVMVSFFIECSIDEWVHHIIDTYYLEVLDYFQ